MDKGVLLQLIICANIVLLFVMLFYGIKYGIKVKTFKQYSVGNRKFSDFIIISTIVATIVSGTYFVSQISGFHKEGSRFLVSVIGANFSIFITSMLIRYRANEFFKFHSVPSIMGNLFGREVRIISALSSIIWCIITISVQVSLLSIIMQHVLGVNSYFIIIFYITIAVCYSILGGIEAICLSNVFQAVIFCLIVLILTFYFIYYFNFLPNNDNGVSDTTINEYNISGLSHICLFFYFLIPSFCPHTVQKILICEDAYQARRSFFIAGLVLMFLGVSISTIGFICLEYFSIINGDDFFLYILEYYMDIPMKFITILALIIMVLSTITPLMNAASVALGYDILGLLGTEKSKLKLSKISVLFIGFISGYIACYIKYPANLLMIAASLYMPVVTVPLLMYLMGFRTNKLVVVHSMIIGISIVFFWRIRLEYETNIDATLPAMLAHFITTIFLHHIGGYEGGWEDDSFLRKILNWKLTKKDKNQSIKI